MSNAIAIPIHQYLGGKMDAINTVIEQKKSAVTPLHRMCAVMLKNRSTSAEIAQALDVDESVARDLISSSPVRQLLAQMVTDVPSTIQDLVDTAAIDSLMTVIELRDKAASEQIRFAAARYLLARRLGNEIPESRLKPVTNNQDIEEELATAEAEIKRLQNLRKHNK
jgi:hypothetical protein